jgi:hypothetical protein
MRATELKFTRRKNLGGYEHEEVTLAMAIDEHDNVDEVINYVKVKVAEALDLQPKASQIKEVKDGGDVVTKSNNTVNPGTGKKVAKKTTKKVAKKSTNKKKEEEKEDVVLTIENVKESLGSVWKAKGKSIALDILSDFGVSKSDELDAKDYGKVVEECNKALG